MQWEYDIVSFIRKDIHSEIEFLQGMGHHRWELVTVDNSGFYYFKRRVE